ncbi:uncharacterized protein LY79DRAFT_29586 [Colletotrichum navitas]|uniref:Uncharacterized protein n=1 Tax=Colletotrichum navitas TaxID=681940 RepID=A0AAD8VDK9_9PEZI|nr:uncharacterized protein LY79DRAFT_29586 [Colletotrichum navitas]KAK1600710.1 hypothetical protein LY79DRAFT_29586 [Colletotrichum navitas]
MTGRRHTVQVQLLHPSPLPLPPFRLFRAGIHHLEIYKTLSPKEEAVLRLVSRHAEPTAGHLVYLACWARRSAGPTRKFKSMPALRVSRITLMASTSTSGNNHRDSPSMQARPAFTHACSTRNTPYHEFTVSSLYNPVWTVNTTPDISSGEQPTGTSTSGVIALHHGDSSL